MSPLRAYAQAQVSTSSQAELVVLLYRGAVRFATKARLHLLGRELESAHDALMRAQEIVVELMLGIRPAEEKASADLYALHDYIYRLLYDANFTKSAQPVDEALRHLRDLLSTWETVALPRRGRQTAGDIVAIDRHC